MFTVLVWGGSPEEGNGFIETHSRYFPKNAISMGGCPFFSFRQLPSASVSFRPQPYTLGPEDGGAPPRETGGSYRRPAYWPF